MRFAELIPVLQAAISPVILISGVGLLLLSMTNRFGRAIDRARDLIDAHRHASPEERQRFSSQVQVLEKRTRFIQRAISLAILSMLFAGLLVISLFVTALFKLELVFVSILLFVACLISLICSLIVFLQDINLALSALQVELKSIEKS